MNLQPLQQYWAERESRERALITAGICFAGTALVVLVLIGPAFSAIARQQSALPSARAQSAQLGALLDQVRALKLRPSVSVGTHVPAALEQSLAAAGLKATQMIPLADGAMRLTFANVSYAAWSVWLAAAERSLGVRATAVTVKAASTPGNVDVVLAFRSGRG